MQLDSGRRSATGRHDALPREGRARAVPFHGLQHVRRVRCRGGHLGGQSAEGGGGEARDARAARLRRLHRLRRRAQHRQGVLSTRYLNFKLKSPRVELTTLVRGLATLSPTLCIQCVQSLCVQYVQSLCSVCSFLFIVFSLFVLIVFSMFN